MERCPFDDSIIDIDSCNNCFFYYDCHVDIVKIKENNKVLAKNTDKFVENVNNIINGGSE